MRIIVLSMLSAFLILLVPASTYAQANGERISSFISSIDISENGNAIVTETIEYQFGSNERRGIFRDIPTQYLVEGDQGYKLRVEVVSVLRNGAIEQYEIISENPNYQRLRIGDPDVYITDKHVYTLVYRIGPVAVTADDGTEIVRFDVPGDGWQVPVDDVKARLTVATEPLSITCYEGILGSTAQTCDESDSLTFEPSATILPGETLTIEAVFDSGTFENTAEITTLDLNSEIPTPVLALIGLAVTGVGGYLLYILYGYFRYLRRRKQEIAYPRYEPPKDMAPAEIGLLIDNSSSGAELTATLVELAVSGHMKIKQTKEKSFFSPAQYEFQKTTPTKSKPLKSYQQNLYDALFAKQAQSVNSKDLSKATHFVEEYPLFHNRLKTSLKNMGFYKKVSIFSPTLSTRMSEEGYAKWAEIEGFREFLQLTEANRMAMLDAPERKPEQFSEYLPYAIALGVEKKWAKQFEHLDVDVSNWYSGNTNAMSAAYVASSIGNGLGGVSSSISKSSGASSGGGGFSGGGFGGGGGGSW